LSNGFSVAESGFETVHYCGTVAQVAMRVMSRWPHQPSFDDAAPIPTVVLDFAPADEPSEPDEED
jgi:hypothetical protein